ncbi:MAG: kelch repeat-containing protein [Pirellulales bacterium]
MMQAVTTQRLLSLGLGAVLAATAAAQNLSLDKVGGALGGVVNFPIHGQPNETYALLLDIVEVPTPLPQLGVTLDITDQFAWLTYGAPGWLGLTNANGDANPSIVIPNDPFFASLPFSLQAIAGTGAPYRKSNLIRLTAQAAGTFADALHQPTAPILGGGAALVADNELLFIGGSGPVAQRYKSRTEDWELAGSTFGVGLLAQTTALADGRWLFTGGLDLTTGQPSAAAAVYDPATQSTVTLTMGSPRAGHGASLLPNGRVLVTGGSSNVDITNPLSLFTGLLATTEIFDPTTNTFAPGPNMLEARAFHTSTTLTTGRVLIAGGLAVLPIVNIPNVSATAYLFNPATNSFGLPSLMNGARFLHSAVPLSNGRVLLIGGVTLDLSVFLTTLNVLDIIVGTRTDCQVFAPSPLGFGTFTTVNGMQVGRAGAAAAPLPNGGALIAGGFQMAIDATSQTFVFNLTPTADVFTQNPNAIAPTGSMAAPRFFPTMFNLPDGTIMVVGGGPANCEIHQR